MLTTVPCHDSSAFQWKGNFGSAEASSLSRVLHSRLTSDALDEGFAMVSPKTGKKLVFVLQRIRKSNDDGVLWMDYLSTDKQIEIRIFND